MDVNYTQLSTEQIRSMIRARKQQPKGDRNKLIAHLKRLLIEEEQENDDGDDNGDKRVKGWVHILNGKRIDKCKNLDCVKKMTVNRKLKEIEVLSCDNKVRVFPLDPEDVIDPDIVDMMKNCYTSFVTFQPVVESDGTTTLKGLLQLNFCKKSDIPEYIEILDTLKDFKIHHTSLNKDLDTYMREWNVCYRGTDKALEETLMVVPSLPDTITYQDLWDMFPKARQIWLQEAIKQSGPDTKEQAAYAYVCFANMEASKQSYKELSARSPPKDDLQRLTMIPFNRIIEYNKDRTDDSSTDCKPAFEPVRQAKSQAPVSQAKANDQVRPRTNEQAPTGNGQSRWQEVDNNRAEKAALQQRSQNPQGGAAANKPSQPERKQTPRGWQPVDNKQPVDKKQPPNKSKGAWEPVQRGQPPSLLGQWESAEQGDASAGAGNVPPLMMQQQHRMNQMGPGRGRGRPAQQETGSWAELMQQQEQQEIGAQRGRGHERGRGRGRGFGPRQGDHHMGVGGEGLLGSGPGGMSGQDPGLEDPMSGQNQTQSQPQLKRMIKDLKRQAVAQGQQDETMGLDMLEQMLKSGHMTPDLQAAVDVLATAVMMPDDVPGGAHEMEQKNGAGLPGGVPQPPDVLLAGRQSPQKKGGKKGGGSRLIPGVAPPGVDTMGTLFKPAQEEETEAQEETPGVTPLMKAKGAKGKRGHKTNEQMMWEQGNLSSAQHAFSHYEGGDDEQYPSKRSRMAQGAHNAWDTEAGYGMEEQEGPEGMMGQRQQQMPTQSKNDIILGPFARLFSSSSSSMSKYPSLGRDLEGDRFWKKQSLLPQTSSSYGGSYGYSGGRQDNSYGRRSNQYGGNKGSK